MSDGVLVACDACARLTGGRCAAHAVYTTQVFPMGVVVPASGPPIAVPGGLGNGPFPGPNWQAECGAAREEAAKLQAALARMTEDRDYFQRLARAAEESTAKAVAKVTELEARLAD